MGIRNPYGRQHIMQKASKIAERMQVDNFVSVDGHGLVYKKLMGENVVNTNMR
jgi:hypothetical protein